MHRRHVIKAAAGVAALGVIQSGGVASAAGRRTPAIRVKIGGRWHARARVLEWESRRIQVAAAKLRGDAVGSLVGDLDALVLRRPTDARGVVRNRHRLLEAKLALGQDAILRRLALDLTATDLASPLSALPRSWSRSHALLVADRGHARGFVRWFQAMVERNRLEDGLIAHPDHYRLVTDADGRQEVVEVTGGAVLASRFVVDFRDIANVSVPDDPRYPHRIVGSARSNGVLIGSVSHQARDLGSSGFAVSLNVDFPSTLPPWFVAEHRWHLACEFSNWVEAYVASRRSR